MLLSRSTEEGEIEHEEREMLYNVFDFADKEVSDVMVPRPEVVGARGRHAAGGVPEGRGRVAVHALSRLPRVARRDRRRPPRPRPVPRRRAVGRHRRTSRSSRCSARRTSSPRRRTSLRCCASSAARRSTWRSSSTSTARWRASSRSRTCWRRSSARSRTSSTFPDESVERVDENRIRIHGTFTIDDFNEEFHVSLPAEDYNTVGGFVFGELGHAPNEGDTVVHDGLRSRSSRRTATASSAWRSSSSRQRAEPTRSEAGPEADEAA